VAWCMRIAKEEVGHVLGVIARMLVAHSAPFQPSGRHTNIGCPSSL
jgi:hypothetical protein